MSLRGLWQCCGVEHAGGDLKDVIVKELPNDILGTQVGLFVKRSTL